ncbi:MAG TPA: YggT family protein [Dehalococcoidia bacterium]|jgi:YggT family protein|nr:YggT family protein [Dehalococcoidia bacterium]
MDILFSFIRLVCDVLTFAIIIRAILSWFLTRPNTLTIILDKLTEPILAPLRRIVPRVGMFDLTPMVAVILLQLIANLLP